MPPTAPYDKLLMDHIKDARNYRVLDDADHQAAGSNPLCGDDLIVYVKIDREHITDIAFQCTCCGISMASASIMTQEVKGMRTAEAHALLREVVAMLAAPSEAPARARNAEQLALLDTVRKYPVRGRCARLAWETLEVVLASHHDVPAADNAAMRNGRAGAL